MPCALSFFSGYRVPAVTPEGNAAMNFNISPTLSLKFHTLFRTGKRKEEQPRCSSLISDKGSGVQFGQRFPDARDSSRPIASSFLPE